MSAQPPREAPPADESRSDARVKEPAPSPWKGGPLAGLLFGLLGGLLAYLLIQAFHPLFAIPDEVTANMMTVPDELQRPVDRNNAMAALAILGGAAAAALSVGEGLCRRSWLTVLAAGAACTLLGAAVGCLAGYLGFIGLEHYQSRADLTNLVKTLRVQSAMLGALGAGVGLGLGAFAARRFGAAIQGLIAGLLAGGLAGMVYPVICAAFMPGVITEVVVPIWTTERLVWIGLFTGLVGVTIPAIVRKKPPKPRSETAARRPE
jgi:hypothetical protein